jgi:hypothetical protein
LGQFGQERTLRANLLVKSFLTLAAQRCISRFAFLISPSALLAANQAIEYTSDFCFWPLTAALVGGSRGSFWG